MKNVTDLTREDETDTATLVDSRKESPPLPPPVDNQGVFFKAMIVPFHYGRLDFVVYNLAKSFTSPPHRDLLWAAGWRVSRVLFYLDDICIIWVKKRYLGSCG